MGGQPEQARQGDARSNERQVRGNHVNANRDAEERSGREVQGRRRFETVLEAGSSPLWRPAATAVMEAGGVVDSSTLEGFEY